MRRTFAIIIAILAWTGLALHFANALASSSDNGITLVESTFRFFSFFTVVSNLIVAITMSLIAFFPESKLARLVNTASIMTATAVYITIVAVVYSLFLRGVVPLEGIHVISNHIVHDIVPPVFILYWLICAPKREVKWIDPVKWLIVPILYIAYSLVHGAFDNWYPYWFADVIKLGYPTALRNAAFVLIAFLIFGFIFAAIARVLSRSNNNLELDQTLPAEEAL